MYTRSQIQKLSSTNLSPTPPRLNFLPGDFFPGTAVVAPIDLPQMPTLATGDLLGIKKECWEDGKKIDTCVSQFI